MPLRNPFESFSFGNSFNPAPKSFNTPNQGTSMNNSLFGGGRKRFNFEFQTPAPDTAGPPEQRDPSTDWMSYLSDMEDLYTKQGPAATAYRDHLNQIPGYQAPGKMNRIAAALTGVSAGIQGGGATGYQAAQGVLETPYRRSLEQWGIKEQALNRSAEQEDDTTSRRVSFMKEARSMAKDENEYRKWAQDYDLKVRNQEADEKYKDAQIQNWKDQGFKEMIDDKGNISYVNPRTGERKDFGPSYKVKDWGYKDDESKRGWADVGVRRENANTARGQLDVSRGNLDVNKENANRLKEREGRYEEPPISVKDQAEARQMAISRAATRNPQWDKFITPEGNIDMRAAQKDPGSYNLFIEEVKNQEKGIFSRKRSLAPSGGVIEY